MLNTVRQLLFKINLHGSRKFGDTSPKDDGRILSNKTLRVSNLDKKLLVWNGKYKTVADVPTYVSPESIEKARSWARVRIGNYMIAFTILSCITMIFYAKKARARGDSVQKRNLDWHKEYEDKHKASE